MIFHLIYNKAKNFNKSFKTMILTQFLTNLLYFKKNNDFDYEVETFLEHDFDLDSYK